MSESDGRITVITETRFVLNYFRNDIILFYMILQHSNREGRWNPPTKNIMTRLTRVLDNMAAASVATVLMKLSRNVPVSVWLINHKKLIGFSGKLSMFWELRMRHEATNLRTYVYHHETITYQSSIILIRLMMYQSRWDSDKRQAPC